MPNPTFADVPDTAPEGVGLPFPAPEGAALPFPATGGAPAQVPLPANCLAPPTFDRGVGPAEPGEGLRRSKRIVELKAMHNASAFTAEVRLRELTSRKKDTKKNGGYYTNLTWNDVEGYNATSTSHTLYTTMHRYGQRDTEFLSALNFNEFPEGDTSAAQFWKSPEGFHHTYGGLIEEFHPLARLMKANLEDNPTWNQAMNGIHASGYWKAMEVELDALNKKGAWDEVERTPEMQIVQSTWAFKCKRYPDGSVNKLKARFCVRGDTQIEGIDYFETFAPVVTWTAVRLMFVLFLALKL